MPNGVTHQDNLPIKRTCGGPVGNKHREKYTLPVAINLFKQALEILKSNEDIITETELAFKCKYELSLPYSTYQYLRSEKYPLELGDLKREIESLLEARVMKCKDMYPGIAAMTLKNKHGWVDKTEVNTIVTMKHLTDDELERKLVEKLNKLGIADITEIAEIEDI